MNKWLKRIGWLTEGIAIGMLVICSMMTWVGLMLFVGLTAKLSGIDINSMPFVMIPTSMAILFLVFIAAFPFLLISWRDKK